MSGPLISSTGTFFPIWSGFADPALRPVLLVARDGSGYQPVDIQDLGSTAIASGLNVNITGIVNNEQVTQIAGSGDVDTAPKVIIDTNGRMRTLASQTGTWNVLSAQSGSWSTTILNPQTVVGITGVTGLGADIFSAAGFNSLAVAITSGTITSTVSNPVTQVGITGQPINVNAGQSGGWNVLARQSGEFTALVAQSGAWSTTTLNPQTKVSITGISGITVDVLSSNGYNAIPIIIASGDIELASLSVGQSGAWNVLAAQSGAFNASVAQSGIWTVSLTGSNSITVSNPISKIGVTGVTGLGVDVVSTAGYNSLTVAITSGTLTSTTSNPITKVGITGSDGLAVQVLSSNGYNAIPIIITSGDNERDSIAVGQSGIWGVLSRQSGEFTVLAAQSGAWSTTTLNPQTKVGITGVTGLGVDITLAGGYNSMMVGVTSGTVTATISNPVSQVSITGQPINVNAGQSGAWTVSLTGSNSIIVSNPDTKVGITGVTGLGADVVLAGGYNSLSTIIPSGNIDANQKGAWNVSSAQSGGWNVLSRQSGEFTALVAQSGAWSVTQLNPQTKIGISGATGLSVDSALAGGFSSLAVMVTSGNVNATINSQPINVNAGQSGAWTVVLTGSNSITVLNPTTKIGITGVTGLATDVVLAGGFNSIPVIITSGSTSASVTMVGITGVTGLGVDVVKFGGYNAMPIVIASGLVTSASGILTSVGISGSTGLIATVTGAYGVNALCVAITSGNSFVRGSGVDKGHRITTSGVSQQVAASNANRRYLKIQNIDDTNMWVNYGSAATSGSGSFILYPGGSDSYENGFIETGSVNVFGLVAGKQYTIKEV